MLWLVDMDAFRRELDNHWPFTKDEQSKHGIADMAKSTLLVVLNNNAVPVARCKDCKHKHLENMDLTCPFGLPGGENFFCGYGAEPYKGEQE